MRKNTIVFCKYYNQENKHCPYREEFITKCQALDNNVGALQPRCPRDAQRDKHGITRCWCTGGEVLC